MRSRGVLITLAALALALALVLVLVLLDEGHDPDPRDAVRSPEAGLPSDASATELAPVGAAERQASAESAPTATSNALPVAGHPSTARLRAHCIDGAGRDLAGVLCVAVNSRVLRAASPRDGRIDVELVVAPDGETRLAIELRCEFRVPVQADRGVRRGELWDLGEVVLLPAGRIRGRVVDAHARAVSEASVTNTRTSFTRWKDAREDDSSTETTDANGAFLLEGVPVGATRVLARARRYAPVAFEPIDVVAGVETSGVEIVLGEPTEAEDAFDVCVLDPDGRAVPGARVAYHTRGASGEASGRRTANEHGCARFPWTAEDVAWLRATDPDDRFAPGHAMHVRGGTRAIELRLSRWIARTLLVVDADGTPVERYAWRLLDERQYFEHGTSTLAEGKRGLFRNTFVDVGTNGEFEPEAAQHAAHPGGTCAMNTSDLAFVVQVGAPGFALTQAGPFARGSMPDTVRVVLERLPAVRGRVVAKDAAVPGAWIHVLRARGVEKTVLVESFESRVEPEVVVETTSATDGSFELTLQDEGDFVLQAGRDDVGEGELGPVHVAPTRGADGLVLELVPFGSIEGVVLVARGERAADFVVGASGGEGRPRSVRPDAHGAFRLGGLRPGPWLLLPLSDTLLPGFPLGWEIRDVRPSTEGMPSTCIVRPGEVTHVEIDLRNKPELTARSDVAPWSEARWDLELKPIGATFSRGAQQGRVLLRDVRLRVDAPG